MRTALLALALCLGSLAIPSTAAADGWYFSESVGSGELGSELAEHLDLDITGRMALGRRMGKLAVEGILIGNGLSGSGDLVTMMGYGISARYLFPVSRHLEFYFRGGLHKSRLFRTSWSDDLAYRGRAIHYGAGAQVKTKVPALGLLFAPLFFSDLGPKMTVALFLEAGGELTRLHHEELGSHDASTRTWMLGFALGSDF